MMSNRDAAVLTRQIESAAYGSLIQLIELTGRAIGSDIVAGKIMNDDTDTLHHVRAWRALPDEEESALQNGWPTNTNTLFDVLTQNMCEQDVFRFSEVLPVETWQNCDPLPQLRNQSLCDIIGLCVPISDGDWASFIYFRLGPAKPFDLGAISMLSHLKPTLEQQLSISVAYDQGKLTLCNTEVNEQMLSETLSRTEQKVLDHLLAGITERAIGEAMQRSRHTVHVHVKNIYRKLQVNSRTQLLEKLKANHNASNATHIGQSQHSAVA